MDTYFPEATSRTPREADTHPSNDELERRSASSRSSQSQHNGFLSTLVEQRAHLLRTNSLGAILQVGQDGVGNVSTDDGPLQTQFETVESGDQASTFEPVQKDVDCLTEELQNTIQLLAEERSNSKRAAEQRDKLQSEVAKLQVLQESTNAELKCTREELTVSKQESKEHRQVEKAILARFKTQLDEFSKQGLQNELLKEENERLERVWDNAKKRWSEREEVHLKTTKDVKCIMDAFKKVQDRFVDDTLPELRELVYDALGQGASQNEAFKLIQRLAREGTVLQKKTSRIVERLHDIENTPRFGADDDIVPPKPPFTLFDHMSRQVDGHPFDTESLSKNQAILNRILHTSSDTPDLRSRYGDLLEPRSDSRSTNLPVPTDQGSSTYSLDYYSHSLSKADTHQERESLDMRKKRGSLRTIPWPDLLDSENDTQLYRSKRASSLPLPVTPSVGKKSRNTVDQDDDIWLTPEVMKSSENTPDTVIRISESGKKSNKNFLHRIKSVFASKSKSSTKSPSSSIATPPSQSQRSVSFHVPKWEINLSATPRRLGSSPLDNNSRSQRKSKDSGSKTSE